MDSERTPFKKGMIILWSGSIATIPTGWHLCDGNSGTPNLKNRFIVGAGDTYNPDAVGGSVEHTHDLPEDGHYHTISEGTALAAGTDVSEDTDFPSNERVITDSANGLPPYYALAYIMKL